MNHTLCPPPSERCCYTCAHYGDRWGRTYVVCDLEPGQPMVASQPATGCVFWARAPGSDDGPWQPVESLWDAQRCRR